MDLSRRKFLELLGGSGASLILSACRSPQMPAKNGDPTNLPASSPAPTLAPTIPPPTSSPSVAFQPDVEISLQATLDEAQILPGAPTKLAKYVGELHKGDAGALQPIPNSYLGPTIHLKRGQKVRITLQNDLPSDTIIHWHGQHLPEEMDGHPRYAIPPQAIYVYEFAVNNRAGTYWYHPHPHQQTGGQVYFGLAGFLIIHDDESAHYNLPQGEFDLPLVIQNRLFDAENQLTYVTNGHQIMTGFFGNRILINGQLNNAQNVAARSYRLRLLNGSNARTYKLAWDDGSPLTVIATDGGLLSAPVTKPYLMLSSAERADVWVDFSQFATAGSRKLIALPFAGGNETLIEIAQFNINRTAESNDELPAQFAPLAFHNIADAVNAGTPRTFNFYVNHMTPVVDGMRFDMNNVTENETVKLNDLEVWELTNHLNGDSGFPHPIHLHGVQFQIIERTDTPADVADGYVDNGWKDTVLLMPNERVKILLKFEDYTGLFLYHCHNLEHEDGGMMRNYRVTV